jgi:hypothetical protein
MWPYQSKSRRQNSSNARRRRGFQRLFIEALEQRTLLSQVSWTNPAGGDWDTASNWSGSAVPGTGDDVVITIPVTGTITHSQNINDVINSLTSSDP